MTITISVGINKGGVSKTTTAAIISYLLAKESRVLAVDTDQQGNLSRFLSRQKKGVFRGKTLYEACRDGDPAPYVYRVHEKLHLLPADIQLGGFDSLLDENNRTTLLRDTLEKIASQYDYIIIDQPPALSLVVSNALHAADFAFTPLLTEPLSTENVTEYLEVIERIQEHHQIRFAGILLTMFDPRARLDKAIRTGLMRQYPDFVFKTVIQKRARIKEYSAIGIQDRTKKDREILEPYQEFIQELRAIVQER